MAQDNYEIKIGRTKYVQLTIIFSIPGYGKLLPLILGGDGVLHEDGHLSLQAGGLHGTVSPGSRSSTPSPHVSRLDQGKGFHVGEVGEGTAGWYWHLQQG